MVVLKLTLDILELMMMSKKDLIRLMCLRVLLKLILDIMGNNSKLNYIPLSL